LTISFSQFRLTAEFGLRNDPALAEQASFGRGLADGAGPFRFDNFVSTVCCCHFVFAISPRHFVLTFFARWFPDGISFSHFFHPAFCPAFRFDIFLVLGLSLPWDRHAAPPCSPFIIGISAPPSISELGANAYARHRIAPFPVTD
jgi:hypothetical protein